MYCEGGWGIGIVVVRGYVETRACRSGRYHLFLRCRLPAAFAAAAAACACVRGLQQRARARAVSRRRPLLCLLLCLAKDLRAPRSTIDHRYSPSPNGRAAGQSGHLQTQGTVDLQARREGGTAFCTSSFNTSPLSAPHSFACRPCHGTDATSVVCFRLLLLLMVLLLLPSNTRRTLGARAAKARGRVVFDASILATVLFWWTGEEEGRLRERVIDEVAPLKSGSLARPLGKTASRPAPLVPCRGCFPPR